MTIFSHLVNTKHSHRYKCTHLLDVTHSHSRSYTNTLSTIYRGTFGTFSVSQKPNKVQAQSHLELSYNQTKPCTHRKLPHQPTKQRENVRMIIMTDNKKETNQKPKRLKGKNPNISIFDGQQANLALSIEAFRGL